MDDTLAARIREMILTGALKPGERVTETALGQALAVSRTPIRSVLPRLASEGLLEQVGKRGFAVRAFSDEESWEAVQLRAMLEGHAARAIGTAGAPRPLLDALDGCLADGDALFEKRHLTLADELAYGRMNARFHQLVVEHGGSAVLRSVVDRLNRLPFVAPAVIVFDQVGLRRAFDLLFVAHGTHHAIVDAIRAKDGARAEALFREHAFQQRTSIFERRARQRAEQAG